MNKDSLEQENNFLKEMIRSYYLPEMAKLKIKVDKVIEYINENYTNPDGSCWHSGFWPILEILKDEKITSGIEDEDNE